MTEGPARASLAETADSQRYLRVLEGGSVTGARLSQGATVGKEAAGRLIGRLKDNRAQSRQAAEEREAIESGRVKDIR